MKISDDAAEFLGDKIVLNLFSIQNRLVRSLGTGEVSADRDSTSSVGLSEAEYSPGQQLITEARNQIVSFLVFYTLLICT